MLWRAQRMDSSLGNPASEWAQIWRTYQPLRTEVVPRLLGLNLGDVSENGRIGASPSNPSARRSLNPKTAEKYFAEGHF
jgi:hypothetical protein